MSRLHLNNNSDIHSYKGSLGSQKQLYIYHVLASVGVSQQKKDIGTTYLKLFEKSTKKPLRAFLLLSGVILTPQQ